MLNSTFNHLKTVVKEGFSLVKTVTIGTVSAVKQDVSRTYEDYKEFKAFQEYKAKQEAKKSTATRTGAKKKSR